MFPILPLTLLGVTVVLVAVMPWHRPHPNHLFFPELLKTHLQDGSELKGKPAEARNSQPKRGGSRPFRASLSSLTTLLLPFFHRFFGGDDTHPF
jgi:hypothetical protein